MKLKLIRYENLKGRTGECELGDATFIYGRNFKGKTTILDAVKLVLLGYHPALDRTAQGVFALCSGDKLEVVAQMANGTDVLQRQWRRSNGSVTKAAHLPLNWPDFPVAVLDADAYFGASDRGKAELLFKAVAAKQDPKFTMKMLDVIETNAGREIADGIAKAVDRKAGRTPTNNEWLSAACTIAEEMRSDAAADVRRYAGTLQGLSAIRASDLEPLDANIEEKLTEARDAMEAAVQEEFKASTARKVELATLDDSLKFDAKLKNDRRDTISALEAKKRRINEHWETLMKNDTCPTCGTKASTFRSGASLIHAEQIAAADAEITAIADGLTVISKRIDKVTTKRHRRKLFHEEVTEAVELKVAEAREKVAAFERNRQRWANEQADKKRLAEARDEHETAQRKETRLKAAKTALQGAKSKVAESTFDPILEAAEAFTHGIMKNLSFNGSELGYWADTPIRWVPWRTFSGTEQLIAFVALQAALAATSEVKIVVTDELGRLDDENKDQFLRNVAAAIKAGVIDQWIGVDTEGVPRTTAAVLGLTLKEVK
jgi:hypothetical protein